MKQLSFVAALFLGSVSILEAQDSKPTATNPPQAMSEKDPSTSTSIAAEEFRGNSQVQSQIIMSLESHHLAGVTVKVTDTAIDLSGKLPDKDAQALARDVAAAYADGRKVNDHTTR